MAGWSQVAVSDALQADRFDADYFKPDDLEAIVKMRRQGATDLASTCTILTGRTPGDYDTGGKLAVVRSGDLVAPLIYATCERPFLRTAPTKGCVRLAQGDLLISSIGMGSIGKISLVMDATDLITVSEVTILRDSKHAPEYLFAYLSGPTGQAQIEREVTGATGQQHLLKSKVGGVLVPEPSAGIQPKLRDLVQTAYTNQEAARLAYTQAEALLESALGLDKLDLTPQLFYERSYADAQTAARCDAEFFQPKYFRLLKHLQRTGQAVRLRDWLRCPTKRGLQPIYDDTGDVRVINSQHVGKTTIELVDSRRTTRAFVDGAGGRGKVLEGDVLLNSTGYITIGRAQTMMESVEAVVDSHVTILRTKPELDPVFLSVFLNGVCGFLQTEQGWTGSSGQIQLRTEVIENFTIWLAPASIQKNVRDYIESAHHARRASRRLLDEAKAMVEKAMLGNGGG